MGQQRLPKRRGSDGGECLYHGVLGCLLWRWEHQCLPKRRFPSTNYTPSNPGRPWSCTGCFTTGLNTNASGGGSECTSNVE
jgi:hypothetical protein